MLFAIGGGMFQSAVQTLTEWGIWDVLIPFALIFVIVYEVTMMSDLFDKASKAPAVIGISVALLTVIPHVTGTYPQGLDVVQIINAYLPQIALVLVTLVVVMMLVGLVAFDDDEQKKKFQTYASWTAIVIVLLILANQLLPWGWNYFVVFPDSDWLAVILGLLVAGLIIFFTLRPGSKTSTDAAAPAAPAGSSFKLVPDFGRRR